MQKQNKTYSGYVMGVLLFFLIFFNNETLANNLCLFINQPSQYVMISVIVFFFIDSMLLKKIYRHFNACVFICVVVMGVSIFSAAFRDIGFTNGYVLVALAVLTGLGVALGIDYEDFEHLYIKYMSFFAIISLVCTYFIKPFAESMGSFFPVLINSAGVPFYDMHLCYVPVDANLIRNFGIFREPGVYAVFLIFAIIMVLNGSEKLEKQKCVLYMTVFVVTLISTFSTTGYIALLAVFVWSLVSRNKLKSWQVILMLALFFGVIFSTGDLISNPFAKLSAEHSSFQSRMESFYVGMKTMFSNVLGYGILRGNQKMTSAYTLNSYHVINTLTTMGVFWGIGFIAVWMLGIVKLCLNRFKSWILLFPIYLLFSSELMIYNPITYVFMFYGLSYTVSRRKA